MKICFYKGWPPRSMKEKSNSPTLSRYKASGTSLGNKYCFAARGRNAAQPKERFKILPRSTQRSSFKVTKEQDSSEPSATRDSRSSPAARRGPRALEDKPTLGDVNIGTRVERRSGSAGRRLRPPLQTWTPPTPDNFLWGGPGRPARQQGGC